MGAFLSAVNNGRAPPSQIIDVMSIYHPFPLRLDSLNKGAPVQYDACLQLGEFPSDKYKGNTAVVLFPLKVSRNPGPKGKFMDGIASKIQTILGQQPDPITGYPDVPAHTGADWSIEDILFMKNKAGDTVSRAFYAWINKTPFPVGVVVMAEPVYISQSNMDAIKRLPITPPSDVIHEIGTPILYKPGPIFDEEGNPQPCPATAADISKKAFDSIKPIPGMEPKKPGVDPGYVFSILLGTLATIVVILGVWAGIKLAMGPGSTVMKSIGDSLGRSLAGGYDAIKKAKLPPMPAIPKIPQSVKDSVNKTRKNLGNRLGLGPAFPKKRQTDIPLGDVFPDINPSGEVKMTTNPLLNRDKTRKNKRGTIGSIANLPPHLRGRKTNVAETLKNPKPGTIGAIANLPAANIPEPDMPAGVTVNPRPRRGSISSVRGLPSTPAAIADAPAPEGTPADIVNTPAPEGTPADIVNTPAPEGTPAEISNLPTPPVNPALAEIEDMEKSIDSRKKKVTSALKKLSAANQAKKALGEVRTINELNQVSSGPAPPAIPSSRNKTLRNSTLKVIAAKQAEKKLGQTRATREIDNWMSDEPASATVPTPSSASPPDADALVPKSEFKTWDRSRQSEYIQKLAKKYNKKLVSGYINVMSQTIGSKPWNPSTNIKSPSRLGKGGRKRRNRRKTANRKKTGRKI